MVFSSRDDRRRRLLSRPFPGAWDDVLERNVWHVECLAPAEREALRRAVAILLAEKSWEGCGGLELDDEMRVTIAGFAAVMALGFEGFYFDGLRTILVYPGGFIVERESSPEKEHLLGEAHEDGLVIVSWWDGDSDSDPVLRVAEVVFHEFAHLVDINDLSGDPAGRVDAAARREILAVLEEEHARHAENARRETPTVLPYYGALDRREFFAVATECFFLEPAELREERPRLHDALARWYGQDAAERYRFDREPPDDSEDAETIEREELELEIDGLTRAIEEHPDFADAYRQRGWAYLDLGDPAAAAADFTTLLDLAPDDDEGFHGRGQARYHLGEHAAAADDFGAAVRLNDGDAASLAWRGLCHLELGNPDAAIADATAALRRDPELPLAYRARSRALEKLGRHEEATRDANRADELDTSD